MNAAAISRIAQDAHREWTVDHRAELIGALPARRNMDRARRQPRKPLSDRKRNRSLPFEESRHVRRVATLEAHPTRDRFGVLIETPRDDCTALNQRCGGPGNALHRKGPR